MDQLTELCTVEDVLTFNKKDIQQSLRLNQKKLPITGSKLELATRACEHIKSYCLSASVEENTVTSHIANNGDTNTSILDKDTLNSGWTSEKSEFPTVTHRDVENYLVNSNHRTLDRNKMECYRQYIRGFNFFKEQYIHKLMVNSINDEVPYCYVRSKCYPSMKQGIYVQWILLTKNAPLAVRKANCTCPAGLGEGCTHIAGLLFALEDLTVNKKENGVDNIACTSKPCEWNKPAKRNKTCKTVDEIEFKRIKYDFDGEKKRKTACKPKIKTKSMDSFREKLC